MPNAVKQTAGTSLTTGIAGVTVNSGAGYLGSEINNATDKRTGAVIELTFTHGTAPTANRVWLVYLLYAVDGTNYEDGGTSVQPSKQFHQSIPVKANTSAQKMTLRIPNLLPFKFKPLVWNDTNQNSSSSSVTLKMYAFDDEIQ